MSAISTIGRFLFGSSWEDVTDRARVLNDLKSGSTTETEIFINSFAIYTVIEYIASMVAQTEWRTIYGGKHKKGMEWARLNYKPNNNQNAQTFWQEAIETLLSDNELLIVPIGDQLIIAENFTHHEEYALREDVFENVRRGDLTFDRTFMRSEVYYLKYSNSKIAMMLDGIMAMYSKMISQSVEDHTKFSGERGILNVQSAANGPKEFEEKYGAWINKRFKSYFGNRNAVLPLFKGMSYQATSSGTKTDTTSNDVKTLMTQAIAEAARAFHIPPSVYTGEVAGIDQALNLMLTGCIDPIVKHIATELTAQQFTKAQIASGDKIVGYTGSIKHHEMLDATAAMDKLFAIGVSYNDLMEDLDRPTINEPWANAHHVTKNYADVNEGGEKSAEN